MNPASTDARNKRVGGAIRKRRQVLDLEQRELAELVGVHVNTVQKWESGTHYPGRKLGKLEAVLGISLDEAPETDPLLRPEDDHERFVLSMDSLTRDDKRQMISSYRKARQQTGGQFPLPPRTDESAPGRRSAAS